MQSKPDLSTAAAVEKRFKEISQFVDRCVDEIESNAEVDMTGLEYAVEYVCDTFTKLPDKDQDKLDKYLNAMVKSMENLAATLKSHPALTELSDTDFLDYDGNDEEDWDDEDEDDE